MSGSQEGVQKGYSPIKNGQSFIKPENKIPSRSSGSSGGAKFTIGKGAGEYEYVPIPSDIMKIIKGPLKSKWLEILKQRAEAIKAHAEYYTKVMLKIGYPVPETNPTMEELKTEQFDFKTFLYAFIGARIKTDDDGTMLINKEALDYIKDWLSENV